MAEGKEQELGLPVSLPRPKTPVPILDLNTRDDGLKDGVSRLRGASHKRNSSLDQNSSGSSQIEIVDEDIRSKTPPNRMSRVKSSFPGSMQVLDDDLDDKVSNSNTFTSGDFESDSDSGLETTEDESIDDESFLEGGNDDSALNYAQISFQKKGILKYERAGSEKVIQRSSRSPSADYTEVVANAQGADNMNRLGSQPSVSRRERQAHFPEKIIKQRTEHLALKPALKKRSLATSNNRWRVDPEKLIIGDVIGRGAFGVVRRGSFLGSPVAIKVINSKVVKDEEALRMFKNEAKVMRSLRHPNIVLLIGLTEVNGELLLVQEFVGGGSLQRLLGDRQKKMPWSMKARIALQIARALAYLHERNCLHRDLKCENVLLDENGTAKVADFGLSRILGDDSIKHLRRLQAAKQRSSQNMTLAPAEVGRRRPRRGSGLLGQQRRPNIQEEPTLHFGSRVGSTWYRAPEVEDAYYSSRIDIFSFGIVLGEIITRETGEEFRLAITYEKKIPKGSGSSGLSSRFGVDHKKAAEFIKEFAPACPPGLIQLAEECVNEDPSQRPAIGELVQRLQEIYDSLHQLEEHIRQSVKKRDGELVWLRAHTPVFTGNIHQELDISELARVIALYVLEVSERELEDREIGFIKNTLRMFKNKTFVTSHDIGKPWAHASAPAVPNRPPATPITENLIASIDLPVVATPRNSNLAAENSLDHLHKIDLDSYAKFWTWFNKIIKTIQSPLIAEPFRVKLISGFVLQATALDMLEKFPEQSTCIIRFSQTAGSSLVFEYRWRGAYQHVRMTVTKNGLIMNQRHYVSMKQAFANDFDLRRLKYIYPNRPVDDQVFVQALAVADAGSTPAEISLIFRTTSF